MLLHTRGPGCRGEMPVVTIERDDVFEGPDGQASLLDLFEDRTQLIAQHFMFDPAWDEGCPVCSYQADSLGILAHLPARETSCAAVSRAPISKIEPFRQRMGWPSRGIPRREATSTTTST